MTRYLIPIASGSFQPDYQTYTPGGFAENGRPCAEQCELAFETLEPLESTR